MDYGLYEVFGSLTCAYEQGFLQVSPCSAVWGMLQEYGLVISEPVC
jgi:hypothetical protein